MIVKKRPIILKILIFFLFCCRSFALTYYLDNSATGANNGGAGNDAWQTLAAAQTALTALGDNGSGDTVVVSEGTGASYGEFAEADETRTDWLIFIAAVGENPLFDNIDISNTSQASCYLRFEDLTIRAPTPDPLPTPDGSRVADSYEDIVNCLNANYLYFDNCDISGVTGQKYLTNGMEFNTCDNTTVIDCNIHRLVKGVRFQYSDTVAVTGCAVHNLSEGSGISIQVGCTNTTITRCHIYDQFFRVSDTYYPSSGTPAFHVGSGIAIRSNGVTVDQCIVHDGWSQGLMWYADEVADYSYQDQIIQNCLFYDTGRVALNENGSTLANPNYVRNNLFVGQVDITGTAKYNIFQRYARALTFVLDADSANDGTGFNFHNNVVVGIWPFGDPNNTSINQYTQGNNVFWVDATNYDRSGWGDTNSAFGSSTFVVWRGIAAAYRLCGYPNFFEDIGYTGTTDEYNYGVDGITPCYFNPAYATATGANPTDPNDDRHTLSADFRLAASSPLIDLGDASADTAASLGSQNWWFINNDGVTRDASNHSVGPYEQGLAVTPTTQPSSIAFSNVTATTMTVSWTRGDMRGSLLVMKSGSAVTATPSDGTEYTASAVFGSGTDIGTSEFVVYYSVGSTVNVTGLTAGTTYHCSVFAYGGGGTGIDYLTATPLTGNQATTAITVPEIILFNLEKMTGGMDK